MSGTLSDDTSVKEEPPCEEHAAAALRVRESQVKLEPGECSETQPAQERAGRAGTSASMQDLYLIYEGHVMKGEELAIGPEVWQQPLSLICRENTNSELPSAEAGSGPWDQYHLPPVSAPIPHGQTPIKSPKTVSNSAKLICDICKEEFRNKYCLIIHINTHDIGVVCNKENEKPLGSNVKGSSETTAKSTINKKRSQWQGNEKTEDEPNCNVHKKNITYKSTPRNHLRAHDSDKHTCYICNREYKNLNRHLDNHKAKKAFECDICGKLFLHKYDLKVHIQNSHSKEKLFTCKFCDKRFSRKYSLTRHLRAQICRRINAFGRNAMSELTHHIKCDICNMNFDTKNFKRHQSGHSGEKKFICDMCDKRFTRKSCLVRHIRAHNNEKPFMCEICKKKFITNYELSGHLKRHEKLLQCDICGKNFRRKRDLTFHLRVHSTGRETFLCDYCNKKFFCKHSLKRHLCGHRNKRRGLFLCHICNKTFVYKDSLARHLRVHSDERIACQLCNKQFTMNYLLVRHHLRIHNK